MLNHVVIFWLKSDKIDEGRRVMLEQARRALPAIEGVRNLGAGVSIPSERKVVDTSYHVALTMQFDSESQLQKYQTHPIHQKFVKECVEPYVEKLVVYDFTSDG